MRIHQCDSCKEPIDELKKISVYYGYYTVELCPACGWEIVDLLQDKKLIKLESINA